MWVWMYECVCANVRVFGRRVRVERPFYLPTRPTPGAPDGALRGWGWRGLRHLILSF